MPTIAPGYLHSMPNGPRFQCASELKKLTAPLVTGGRSGRGSHVWSTNKEDEFGQQSASFVQPFLAYTTPKATTFSLNTESTYNWETEEWAVPINVLVSQVVKLGKQPVQFGLGARYWADAPEGGPDDWGLRAQVTLLFPK